MPRHDSCSGNFIENCHGFIIYGLYYVFRISFEKVLIAIYLFLLGFVVLFLGFWMIVQNLGRCGC